MSGKGDKRRPTDEAAYSDGWERIFGNGLPSVREDSQNGESSGIRPDSWNHGVGGEVRHN